MGNKSIYSGLLPLLFACCFMANSSIYCKTLPIVSIPEELESGEYSEGTITKLSYEEISKFIPFACNLKKVLQVAISDSNKLPLNEKVDYLENEVKNVVKRIGKKRYQMLMKFALNRGLLLSHMIKKESNQLDAGIIENRLSILRGAIDTALEFFESDKNYQEKVLNRIDTLNIPYAKFGIHFSKRVLKNVIDIFDASSQFKLMYKSFEMLNWDLSQDKDKYNYAFEIVNIWKTLKSLNYLITKDKIADQLYIQNIRNLYLLFDKLDNVFNAAEISETYQKINGFDLNMELATIMGGTFFMGSPKSEFGRNPYNETLKEVTITYNFKMMVTEVTQEMYFKVIGSNPSIYSQYAHCPSTFRKEISPITGLEVEMCPYNPVEYLTYDEIIEFISVLNSKTGFKFRLPTEAEWEYAARAGTQTVYYFGDDDSALNNYAIFGRTSDEKTHPVGPKRNYINTPNAYGLFDMYGNVMEITEDWYAKDYFGGVNPKGPSIGGEKVCRGGSMINEFREIFRSANRYTCDPTVKHEIVGFRLVLTLD